MKVCFVVQRYGLEVNGGAEAYTREVAEHLCALPGYEVACLTTCAVNYQTWKNEYAPFQRTESAQPGCRQILAAGSFKQDRESFASGPRTVKQSSFLRNLEDGPIRQDAFSISPGAA